MDDLVAYAIIAVLAALLVSLLYILMGRRKKHAVAISDLMPKIAQELGGSVAEGEITIATGDMEVRYSLTLISEGAVQQKISMETSSQLPRFHFLKTGPHGTIDVYPKLEGTEYFASEVRKLLETESDALEDAESDMLTLTTGGICLSPSFGMFSGRINHMEMAIVSRLGEGSIFSRALSDDSGASVKLIAKAAGRAISMMEKIAKMHGED